MNVSLRKFFTVHNFRYCTLHHRRRRHRPHHSIIVSVVVADAADAFKIDRLKYKHYKKYFRL